MHRLDCAQAHLLLRLQGSARVVYHDISQLLLLAERHLGGHLFCCPLSINAIPFHQPADLQSKVVPSSTAIGCGRSMLAGCSEQGNPKSSEPPLCMLWHLFPALVTK